MNRRMCIAGTPTKGHQQARGTSISALASARVLERAETVGHFALVQLCSFGDNIVQRVKDENFLRITVVKRVVVHHYDWSGIPGVDPDALQNRTQILCDQP